MSDDLLYWKNALKGIQGPIHENDPQCGWYRTRPRRGYVSLPVRIWRDPASGLMNAERSGKSVDPCDVWTWCCLNPVSREAFEAVLERGEPWPDEIASPQALGEGAFRSPGQSGGRRNADHGRPTQARRGDAKGSKWAF